jgi:hypothetical protein
LEEDTIASYEFWNSALVNVFHFSGSF